MPKKKNKRLSKKQIISHNAPISSVTPEFNLHLDWSTLKDMNAFLQYSEGFLAAIPRYIEDRTSYIDSFGAFYDFIDHFMSESVQKTVSIDCHNYKHGLAYVKNLFKIYPHYPQCMSFAVILAQSLHIHSGAIKSLNTMNPDRLQNSPWLKLTYKNIMEEFCALYEHFAKNGGTVEYDLNDLIQRLKVASNIPQIINLSKIYINRLNQALAPFYRPTSLTQEEMQVLIYKTMDRLANPSETGTCQLPDSISYYKKITKNFLISFFAYLQQQLPEFRIYSTLGEALRFARIQNQKRFEYIIIDQFYKFCDQKIEDSSISIIDILSASPQLHRKFLAYKSLKGEKLLKKFANFSVFDFSFTAEKSLFILIKKIICDLKYVPFNTQRFLALDRPEDPPWLAAKKIKFKQEAFKAISKFKTTEHLLYLEHFCSFVQGMVDSTLTMISFPQNLDYMALNYLTLRHIFLILFPLLMKTKESKDLNIEEAYELLGLLVQCLKDYYPQSGEDELTYNEIYKTILTFVKNINNNYFFLYDAKPSIVTQVCLLLQECVEKLVIKPEDKLVISLLELINVSTDAVQFNEQAKKALYLCGMQEEDKKFYSSKIFGFILEVAHRLNPGKETHLLSPELSLSFYSGLIIYLEKLICRLEKTINFGPIKLEQIDLICGKFGDLPREAFPKIETDALENLLERVKSLKNKNRELQLNQIYSCIDLNLGSLEPMTQQLAEAVIIFQGMDKNEENFFYREAQNRQAFYTAIADRTTSSPPLFSKFYNLLQFLHAIPLTQIPKSTTILDFAHILQQKLSKISRLFLVHEFQPEENYKRILFDAWLRLFLKGIKRFLFPIFQNLRKSMEMSTERASLKKILEEIITTLAQFENHKTMPDFKRLAGFVAKVSSFEPVLKSQKPIKEIFHCTPSQLPKMFSAKKPKKPKIKRSPGSHQPSVLLNLFQPPAAACSDSFPIDDALGPVPSPSLPEICEEPKKPTRLVRFPCKTGVERGLPAVITNSTCAEVVKKNLPVMGQSFTVKVSKHEIKPPKQQAKQYSGNQFRALKQELALYFECFNSIRTIYLHLHQRGEQLDGFAKSANQNLLDIIAFYTTIYSFEVARIFKELAQATEERKTDFPSTRNDSLQINLDRERERYHQMIEATKDINFVIEQPQSFISYAVNMLIYYSAKLKQPDTKDLHFIENLRNEIEGLQFYLRQFVRVSLNNKYLAVEIDIFLKCLNLPAPICVSPMALREARERYYVLQLFDLYSLADNSLYDLCVWSEHIGSGILLENEYGIQLKQEQYQLKLLITEAKNLGFNRAEAEKMLAYYQVLIPCYEIIRELSLLTFATPLSELKGLLIKGPERAYQLMALNQEIDNAGLFLDFHALLCRLFSLNQELCRPIRQWLINEGFMECAEAPKFPYCEALTDKTIIKETSSLGLRQSSLFAEKNSQSSHSSLERRYSF